MFNKQKKIRNDLDVTAFWAGKMSRQISKGGLAINELDTKTRITYENILVIEKLSLKLIKIESEFTNEDVKELRDINRTFQGMLKRGLSDSTAKNYTQVTKKIIDRLVLVYKNNS